MFSRIQRIRQELSPAEQAVADWVLSHPGRAKDSTLAGVAAAAGTSEPTVIRFCRSLGLSGFRELRLRLAETLSRPTSYLHKGVAADDSVDEVVAKVLDHSIQAMIEVRANAASMPFDEALVAMMSARQLVFAGLGASGIVSRDACQKFFRLGIPCSVAVDTPAILQTAAIVDERDVLIITSHTGAWPDVARAATIAVGNGATVIAMTEPGSLLAKNASLVFECHTPEDTNVYTPMSSRLAHLALFDALQVALALKLGESADVMLRRSKEALANRP
jgi:RpiR family carbohydrate utilization transcriptional regulator